jgi:hypothetical protein
MALDRHRLAAAVGRTREVHMHLLASAPPDQSRKRWQRSGWSAMPSMVNTTYSALDSHCTTPDGAEHAGQSSAHHRRNHTTIAARSGLEPSRP